MDSRYTGEMLKHLEKQNELLTQSHNSMTHELHKLQVEEEMLMRKYYEIMVAQGPAGKKKDSSNDSNAGENGHNTALVAKPSNEHSEDSRNG